MIGKITAGMLQRLGIKLIVTIVTSATTLFHFNQRYIVCFWNSLFNKINVFARLMLDVTYQSCSMWKWCFSENMELF